MNLGSLPGWLAALIALLMVMGTVSRVITYRYAKAGKYHTGDTGYFWREAKKGDRVAFMVAATDAVGVICLVLLIVQSTIELLWYS